MENSKIYPLKGKKTGKAATNEFVHMKIDEIRKHKKRESLIQKTPNFLRLKKDEFISHLIGLDYNP